MKRLHTHSQHFLRNPRFVAELIGHTSIKKSDVVYDIGAGSGVISSVLATRCKQVVAIEVEPQTATILKKNMAAYPNVIVQEADVMAIDLPRSPYKIFANIPFTLSSAIIRKITEADTPPDAAYLIVQKQLAQKLLPNHKGFSSQLGMMLGPRFAIRIRKHLRRTDFWPHPNVDTVLLELKRRDQPLVTPEHEMRYARFIEKHFTTPDAFAQLPIDLVSREPRIKPSSLTLDQWLILFTATNQ